ncbi:MAG: response regulator [Planctomycetota bacterium]|nr:MAG: response regulator [Planctomycetota bacterium]
MIRLLIVEDLEIYQKILFEIFSKDPEIEIVGIAKNGKEAVELAKKLKPHVITMDIHMPVMDGKEATQRIMEENPVPIVVVSSSYSGQETEKAFEILSLGAVGILPKPAPTLDNFEKEAKELLEGVKNYSQSRIIRRKNISKIFSKPKLKEIPKVEWIAIGSSTGGIPVLETILSALPSSFHLSLFIVQHMAKGFQDGFLSWLQEKVKLKIKIPKEGEIPEKGTIYFPPEDYHLCLNEKGSFVLSMEKRENSFRPSVSYLFRSLVPFGEKVAACLLSGMGEDGAKEMVDLKKAGAATIAQSPESAVIFGMPKKAIEYGGVDHILNPKEIIHFFLKLDQKFSERTSL